MEEKKSQIVSSPALARRLMQMDNRLIDIAPKKDAERETVFYFEVTDKFQVDFEDLKANKKK